MNVDEFETIKKAFIERCEAHVLDPTTGPVAAAAYSRYAEQVRKNGHLPDFKDNWATDAFAFAFGQVCHKPLEYSFYFDKMFPTKP